MGCDQYGFHHRVTSYSQTADSIWVKVDRMDKSSHFLAVKTTDLAEDYVKLYINEIMRFNGVPLYIISDIGP